MTKNDLIKKLKAIPGNPEVLTSAHDNSPLEYQGGIESVYLTDFDEIRSSKESVSGDDMGYKGKAIILKG